MSIKGWTYSAFLFEKNFQKKAFELFLDSANEDNPEACWRVAVCYMFSIGTSENIDQAKKLLESAFDYELAEAYFWYGKLLFPNRDCEIYFKKAAEQNHPGALFYVGKSYFYGFFGNQDKNKSIEEMRKCAETGDPFWSKVISSYFKAGLYGLTNTSDEVFQIENFSQEKNLSDCSLFCQHLEELCQKWPTENFYWSTFPREYSIGSSLHIAGYHFL
jgi:TPR repeat protein